MASAAHWICSWGTTCNEMQGKSLHGFHTFDDLSMALSISVIRSISSPKTHRTARSVEFNRKNLQHITDTRVPTVKSHLISCVLDLDPAVWRLLVTILLHPGRSEMSYPKILGAPKPHRYRIPRRNHVHIPCAHVRAAGGETELIDLIVSGCVRQRCKCGRGSHYPAGSSRSRRQNIPAFSGKILSSHRKLGRQCFVAGRGWGGLLTGQWHSPLWKSYRTK